MTQDQTDIISIILGVFFFVLLLGALYSPHVFDWIWCGGLAIVAFLFILGALADWVDGIKARKK